MDTKANGGSGGDTLPVGTVATILENAPKDIVEETIPIPEWECSVVLRSLTAAQAAMVKQRGLGFKGEETTVSWAEMEKMQFRFGVVQPKFKKEDVDKLHLKSGRGFNRVIAWLDEKSAMDKEALREAREEFPGEPREESPVHPSS